MQRVTLSALVLGLGAALAAPSFAQEASVQPMPSTAAEAGPTAPDGSKAFGIEPYLGILGSYASFDNDSDFGSSPTNGSLNRWMITGVGGINIPLDPSFELRARLHPVALQY